MRVLLETLDGSIQVREVPETTGRTVEFAIQPPVSFAKPFDPAERITVTKRVFRYCGMRLPVYREEYREEEQVHTSPLSSEDADL